MSWFQSKEDQLIDEIQNGDVAKVTKLINSGANINYRQEKGQLSPLNAAVEKRNVELIQMLISKGAEVNSKTRNGYSSLMVALSSLECKFDVVDILIRNGADVNAQSFKEKWSPLLLAAAQLNANNKVIQRLVEAGALVDASNIFGATPLMSLAQFGDDEIVNYMLIKGANPNSSDSDSLSPLHYAAGSNGDVFINALITAMRSSAEKGGYELTTNEPFDAFVDSFNNENRIVRAKVTQLLLDHGANVNSTSNAEETPLMVAILAGNTAVAETLIKAGANVYSLHSLGLTALHLAAKMGNVPIIDMLIDHGADVNISPPKAKGETPLMTAVWVGQIDAVKLLIEKGANVNAKMTTGEFALLWAAHKKHYEIFNILREAGAVE